MVNLAPTSPSIIGPANGEAGTEYGYIFNADDPEDDNVCLYIGWGDGTNTKWIGAYESNEEVLLGHMWENRDTYTIRCKAKDTFDAESDWAELSVSMLKSKVINTPFLQFLQNFLENYPLIYQLLQRFFKL